MKVQKDGITDAGKEANELFCDETGFKKAVGNDPKGDAFEYVSSLVSPSYVEIKKDTYNQVRPYKYVPAVGYDSEKDEWYLIPADVLILEEMELKRGKKARSGQHTKDPMEVVGLGKVSKKCFQKYKVEKEKLREKVIEAILQADKNVLVKEYAAKKRAQYEKEPEVVKDEIETLKKEIDAQTNKQRLP